MLIDYLVSLLAEFIISTVVTLVLQQVQLARGRLLARSVVISLSVKGESRKSSISLVRCVRSIVRAF